MARGIVTGVRSDCFTVLEPTLLPFMRLSSPGKTCDAALRFQTNSSDHCVESMPPMQCHSRYPASHTRDLRPPRLGTSQGPTRHDACSQTFHSHADDAHGAAKPRAMQPKHLKWATLLSAIALLMACQPNPGPNPSPSPSPLSPTPKPPTPSPGPNRTPSTPTPQPSTDQQSTPEIHTEHPGASLGLLEV